jgi:hypothetical protein
VNGSVTPAPAVTGSNIVVAVMNDPGGDFVRILDPNGSEIQRSGSTPAGDSQFTLPLTEQNEFQQQSPVPPGVYTVEYDQGGANVPVPIQQISLTVTAAAPPGPPPSAPSPPPPVDPAPPQPAPSLPAVSSIGTASGRDFSTIDAWVAAVEALGTISISTYPNGVTGECYNDSEFTPGELIFRNVNTSEFNGTGIFAITLTTGPGQSFRDNANVRTNALAYNQANGVGLNFNQSSYPITGGGLTVANTGYSGTTLTCGNILISNLQIKVSTGNRGLYTDNNSPSAGPVVVQNVIVDDPSGGTPVFTGTSTVMRNSLVIVRGFQDPEFVPHGAIFDGPAGVGAHFYGVLVVSTSDNSPTPQNAWTNSSGEGVGETTTWHNCGFFGFQQPSDVTGSGATYANCMTNNTISATGITGGETYANQFVVTTSSGADFRTKTGSNLIGAGAADSTNLPYDISGFARPLTGAIDIGCWEITSPSLTMTVNGSTTPAAVISGDSIHVSVSGIPSATGIRVTLEDSSNTVWNAVPGSGYISYAGSSADLVIALSAESIFDTRYALGTGSGLGTTPGTYHARLYFDSAPGTIQLNVPFTVNNFVPYPFPLLSGTINPNGMGLMIVGIGAASGGTILSGSTGFCPAVHGNISVGLSITGPASGLSPLPTNITMQFYAVDGNLTYHAMGSPAFGSPPSIASFNTATLTDGSYLIFGKIIDIADTSANHWVAANFAVVPQPIVIQNGATPMNPASNYMIPACYYGNNRRLGSTTPDAIPYNGVPVAAASSPYPSDAAAGNYLLAVTNASSPFNSNPASARNPPLGFWWEGVDGTRTDEYKSPVRFSQTNAGGIFSQSWYGKTTGSNSIEGAYPAVAAGSYPDGGRNSNQTTNFTTVVATPSTGPWSAYHWTFIQEDGRLGVMDLAGNKVTIAGPKRNTTQLPVDWLDTANVEFPNSVQVGTIDTNPIYTFGDFGGAPADCCWDPRDPYICYVSQTVDHCIIKVNFHTQTLGGVNYSATNPLCQRYAGYKGGINADGVGGYANGVALSTGTNGAQFNGVYSITMQHRTDNSTYPQGTMFVADNYNGLIRIVSAGTLDSNGNQATPSTVSTLVGTHGGAVPVSTAFSSPFAWNVNVLAALTTISVTSMTDNGDGTATVVLASSPASAVTSVGWKMYVQVNGSLYEGAGGTYENSLGLYTVSAFTNSTHFSLTLHPVPTGTITVVICAADTYSSPQPVSFTNAYTAYPNTIRMTSKGDLVYGEAWYNMMCRRIWLNNNPNTSSSNWNTITRLLPFGNNAFAAGPTGVTSSTSFGWFEIDITGACGPVDDIVSFKTDSNPGSAANAFRFSLDLSYNSGGSSFSGGDWFGDGGPDFPSEGSGGVGHYPWGFCFSRTAFRMLSIGLDPSGWFQWRARTSGDPDGTADAIGGTGAPIPTYEPYLWLDTGWTQWQQGSRGILPYGFRPAIAAMMGSNGLHFYGANTGPTIDDLPGLYTTNATLAAYIQGGFFGSVHRPEFSFDDDGVTPGRALAALMYFIRRQALSGSWPTQQSGLFAYQNGLDGSGQLVASGQWSLNYVRPQITVQAGDPTRVSATSIRVRWTTDKNTLGIVIAGTPNSNVTSVFGYYPYNFWTTLEMDNSAAWGTTHDVTITGLPANNVTPPAGSNAPNNVAVLVIDRAGNWNVSRNFSVA